MSTKQIRLSDPAQIRNRINEFVGKKINIVLTDNTTQVGALEAVKGSSIVLRNMRQKKSVYPLTTISELYSDTTV
jgi:small nuclear ribonucleoprotein (snRNP)-like protein